MVSVLQCKCSAELEECEGGRKKGRGEERKVMERERQEGGEWWKEQERHRERERKRSRGERKAIELKWETEAEEGLSSAREKWYVRKQQREKTSLREHLGVSVLVQSNSTSGSTGDRGEKLLG